jgi:hypothetical protein
MEKTAIKLLSDVYNELVEEGASFPIWMTGPTYCYKFVDLLGGPCDLHRPYRVEHDILSFYGKGTVISTSGAEFLELTPLQDNVPPLSFTVSYQDPHMGKGRTFEDRRIIEFLISDEGELSDLRQGHFANIRTQFHNLKRAPRAASEQECVCSLTQHTLALVYESGKCYFETNSLEALALKLRQQRAKTLCYVILPVSENHWATTTEALRLLRQEGRDVRHCLLCESYARKYPSPKGRSGFCRLKNRYCESNEGASCPQFVPVRGPSS